MNMPYSEFIRNNLPPESIHIDLSILDGGEPKSAMEAELRALVVAAVAMQMESSGQHDDDLLQAAALAACVSDARQVIDRSMAGRR